MSGLLTRLVTRNATIPPARLARSGSRLLSSAAQIRAQGYKCDDPQSAKQDVQASRPDEAVWLLQCEDASYRVRLDPDMAATVERVNGKEDTER